MTIQEQDIRDITESVWTHLIKSSAETCVIDETLPGPFLTGCVQMTGAWEGAVTLRCSPLLARTVAATMYELQLGEPSDDQIHDALGEVANVVGGNIKALLPGPTHLSLPIVARGDRRSLTINGTEAVHTVWFASHGEAFVVTLLSRIDEPTRPGARCP
jgi:chemotaxis protein CheX